MQHSNSAASADALSDRASRHPALVIVAVAMLRWPLVPTSHPAAIVITIAARSLDPDNLVFARRAGAAPDEIHEHALAGAFASESDDTVFAGLATYVRLSPSPRSSPHSHTTEARRVPPPACPS